MKKKHIVIISSALLVIIVFFFCYNRFFIPLILVDGYTDRTSYFPGDTLTVFLNAKLEKHNAKVSLCRIGGKKVDHVICGLGPQEIADDKPWENGFGYHATFNYPIPELKSGLYLWENKIPFIIKSKDENVDGIIVYPANTINAYSKSGGKWAYSPANMKGDILSFLRPQAKERGFHEQFFKWVDRHTSYNMAYISDIDLEDYKHLENSKLLIIAGHSEYWTRNGRINFDRFVDTGNNAIVLSGNTMWWQVRYNEDKTQMMIYKNKSIDPVEDPLLLTIKWTESELGYPVIKSIGADFYYGGYGRRENGWFGYRITNPGSPLLEGVNISDGDILRIPSIEYDGAPLTGFDENGLPVLDTAKLNFYKIELIGYDRTINEVEIEGVATFIVFQKTAVSGIIINTCSMNWCSYTGINGKNWIKIRKITRNMIDKLISGSDVFSQ